MIEVDLRGVEALTRANAAFPKVAARAIKNSLTRTTRRVATQVRKEIRTGSGIGRSIWGQKAGGLTKQKLVSIIPPHASADAIETGLSFRGIPKLVEQGGRIKAHVIKANRSKRLIFEGRAGRTVVTHSVKHPGAAVRAHLFGQRAIRQNEPTIADDVNRSIQNAVNEVYEKQGGDFEVRLG